MKVISWQNGQLGLDNVLHTAAGSVLEMSPIASPAGSKDAARATIVVDISTMNGFALGVEQNRKKRFPVNSITF